MKVKILIVSCLLISFLVSCGPSEIGACFNANDNNVSVNEVITFTNCSSLQTANQLCHWSFGDGNDTTVAGNAAVQHAFKTIGQYEVKLTTGEGAKLSTHTLEISVF